MRGRARRNTCKRLCSVIAAKRPNSQAQRLLPTQANGQTRRGL